MAEVIIMKTADGRIVVKSPYNSEFVATVKARGGKWDGAAWIFHPANEAWVRAECLRWYGTDGVQTVPRCTLRAAFPDGACKGRGPLTLCGRVLSRASGRDSGAKMGDGVDLESGAIGSGGSMRNWVSDVEPGTVFLLRDIPRPLAEEMVVEDPRRFSIIEDASAIDAASLSAERARLAARIAEIDKLLAA